MERNKFIVPPEYSGKSAKEFLKEAHGYSSRSFRKMTIFVNGKKVNSKKIVKKLNRVEVVLKDKGTSIEPKKTPLNIAFEDERLLVINKEPFLIVHPTKKKVDMTLANGVVYYLKEKTGKVIVPRFYNRLDMNTSGLIVIVKDAHTQALLQDKCQVKKKYLAILDGLLPDDHYLIEKAIGQEDKEDLRRVVLPESRGGKYAKTEIKVLKRNETENLTLVEVELFTGRTHQIRVHTKDLGFPILGDELYHNKDKRCKRQLLHAYFLEITSLDKNPITIEADMPNDFRELFPL